MNGADFLNAINGLDASIIEEAGQEETVRRVRRRRRTKTALAAALLCVCLTAGGGAAAASVLGIELFNFSSGESSSSYDAAFQIEPKPLSAFKGPIVETLREIVPEQFAEYELWNSRMPGVWSRNFWDWESAVEFLGVDFLRAPVTSLEPDGVELYAHAAEDGTLVSASLTGNYRTDDYNIFAAVYIYTEACGEGTTAQVFSATDGGAEYAPEEYVTSGGIYCRIVHTSETENNGAMSEGYFVKDGLMYRITLIERSQDERERRAELLKQLLEEAAGR